MNDQAEMTLDELNRAIAEAQGWTKVDDIYEGLDDYAKANQLTLIEKVPVGLMPQYWNNLANDTEIQILPQWTTDPAVALELLAEIIGHTVYNQQPYAAQLAPPPHGDISDDYDDKWLVYCDFRILASAPTAAEAIARAWWAWKAGQDD